MYVNFRFEPELKVVTSVNLWCGIKFSIWMRTGSCYLSESFRLDGSTLKPSAIKRSVYTICLWTINCCAISFLLSMLNQSCKLTAKWVYIFQTIFLTWTKGELAENWYIVTHTNTHAGPRTSRRLCHQSSRRHPAAPKEKLWSRRSVFDTHPEAANLPSLRPNWRTIHAATIQQKSGPPRWRPQGGSGKSDAHTRSN